MSRSVQSNQSDRKKKPTNNVDQRLKAKGLVNFFKIRSESPQKDIVIPKASTPSYLKMRRVDPVGLA